MHPIVVGRSLLSLLLVVVIYDHLLIWLLVIVGSWVEIQQFVINRVVGPGVFHVKFVLLGEHLLVMWPNLVYWDLREGTTTRLEPRIEQQVLHYLKEMLMELMLCRIELSEHKIHELALRMVD